MEPHQRLHVFLPKLRLALVRRGLPNETAAAICDNILNGVAPSAIETQEGYREAWLICDAMEEILTTLDDGSEAAEWCTSLAHRIFGYEDQHKLKLGYLPLNAAPPERTDGPVGNA